MKTIRTIFVIILLAVAALFAIALLTGIIVLLAVGVGWVLVNPLHLPFSMLQGTVLALVAMCLVAWIAMRLAFELPATRRWRELERALEEEREEEADEPDEHEEDESEADIVGDEREPPRRARHVGDMYAWEPPVPRAEEEVPETDPNQRCPCGSGRKYKNCHGRMK
ncbi:MAG: SEC-C metal-binding domain-containing protein [Acidobacteriota bacterium]